MDDARRQQIEMIRSWTPAQRIAAAGPLIKMAVALRDARRRGELAGDGAKNTPHGPDQGGGHVPTR